MSRYIHHYWLIDYPLFLFWFYTWNPGDNVPRSPDYVPWENVNDNWLFIFFLKATRNWGCPINHTRLRLLRWTVWFYVLYRSLFSFCSPSLSCTLATSGGSAESSPPLLLSSVGHSVDGEIILWKALQSMEEDPIEQVVCTACYDVSWCSKLIRKGLKTEYWPETEQVSIRKLACLRRKKKGIEKGKGLSLFISLSLVLSTYR